MRLLPALGLLLTLAAARAADAVEYVVRLDAPQTQMVDVSMTIDGVDAPTLDVLLPTWRPGRYVILDQARGVRDVRAFDGAGRALPVTKRRKSVWRVDAGGAATVRLEYRLYANELETRTRHVDGTHAFLSGESVFMLAPARRDEPVRVTIHAPEGWRIATGLERDAGDPRVFHAPGYDALADAPFEIGPHEPVAFEVEGVPHEIVVWGPDAPDPATLVDDLATIVRAQKALFGWLPYDRFVFMIHVAPGLRGATEHATSTIIQARPVEFEGDEREYERFLSIASHELYHAWNVEQLRPAALHRYDYERENYTELLWVVEGTTSYYEHLVLVRSGLLDADRYLEILAESVAALRRRPGRHVQSLEASSFDAWLAHGRSPDGVNSSVSFYRKGALASLVLDLELRRRTDGAVTLDHVMREMLRRFPLERGGYTTGDLLRTLRDLSGSAFDEFHARFVRGTEPLELEAALATVGLDLRLEPDEADDAPADGDDADDAPAAADDAPLPMRAYLGLDLRERDGRAIVRSARADGPAFAAGLAAGDEIVALDGRRLRAADLATRLEQRDPGDVVRLTRFRRDALEDVHVTLGATPAATWRLRRVEAPTDAQIAAYEAWLQRDWPEAGETDPDAAPATVEGTAPPVR